mgnify:CR=1 FL=1
MLTASIDQWPDDLWDARDGNEAPAWQYFAHILMGIDYWLPSENGHAIPDFARRVNTNLGEPSHASLTRQEVRDFSLEVGEKVERYFHGLTDEQITAPSPVYDQWTHLDVIVEVIRHTQHHVGQLNLLLSQKGHLPPEWDYHQPDG